MLSRNVLSRRWNVREMKSCYWDCVLMRLFFLYQGTFFCGFQTPISCGDFASTEEPVQSKHYTCDDPRKLLNYTLYEEYSGYCCCSGYIVARIVFYECCTENSGFWLGSRKFSESIRNDTSREPIETYSNL